MLIIPLGVLLTFPISNYEDPVTRGQQISIISLTIMSLTTFFVFLRLYQRLFIRKWFGPDDLFVVLGYIFAVGVTAATVYGNERTNWNRHIWDMELAAFQPSLKLMYLSRIFWGLSTSFIRLSVLCLYHRLLRSSEAPRRYFIILQITTSLIGILMLYYLLSGVVPCIPIRAYWTWPPIVDRKCFDDSLSLQVSAIVNTILEFWVATMPLLATFTLGVQRSQRWSVVNILCLGYITVIAGIFRTFFIWKAVETWDYTWWSGPQWIASEAEIDSALICACAAPLRPLISQIAKKFGSYRSGRTTDRLSKAGSESDFDCDHSGNTKKLHDESVTTKMSTTQDHEAAREWTEMMSRTIDLEGIAADGFGYTVTISGPLSNRVPKRPTGLFRLPWRRPSVSHPHPEPAQSGVSLRKDILVSAHHTWNSSSDQSPTKKQESRINSLSPAALDEMTFESMGLGTNCLLRDNGLRDRASNSTHRHPLQLQSLEPSTKAMNFHTSNKYPRCKAEGIDEENIEVLPRITTNWPNSVDERPIDDVQEISWFGEPPIRKLY